MTIDEKVVAYMRRTITYQALRGHYDGERVITEKRVFDDDIPLIPQSAYAELAAERDEMKFRVEQLDALVTRINDRADTAESQLAELRGRLEELASEYAAEAERHLMHAANKDWAEWVRADHSSRASELNGAAREIRALAAADGG